MAGRSHARYGEGMRWMIALDLGARSGGVLELAAWLRARSGAAEAHEFVAVHVLDERARRLLGAEQQNDLIAFADRALHEFVDEFAVEPAVTSWRVVSAESPERGIIEALGADGFDGVILGRVAERGGRQRVRLGRVARRLLRRLPRPVVVVPPHLTSATLGVGPLLLATDLSNTSMNAAAFARRLATELGRELVVVHVDPGFQMVPTFWGEPVAVPALPHRIPADVDDWASSIGLEPIRTRLAEGDVVENVLDIATLEEAPLIICGSRGLDAFDRIFVSSTSVDLARHAACPVIVVPSQ